LKFLNINDKLSRGGGEYVSFILYISTRKQIGHSNPSLALVITFLGANDCIFLEKLGVVGLKIEINKIYLIVIEINF